MFIYARIPKKPRQILRFPDALYLKYIPDDINICFDPDHCYVIPPAQAILNPFFGVVYSFVATTPFAMNSNLKRRDSELLNSKPRLVVPELYSVSIITYAGLILLSYSG